MYEEYIERVKVETIKVTIETKKLLKNLINSEDFREELLVKEKNIKYINDNKTEEYIKGIVSTANRDDLFSILHKSSDTLNEYNNIIKTNIKNYDKGLKKFKKNILELKKDKNQIVTAFTISHSITLSLSMFNILTLQNKL